MLQTFIIQILLALVVDALGWVSFPLGISIGYVTIVYIMFSASVASNFVKPPLGISKIVPLCSE